MADNELLRAISDMLDEKISNMLGEKISSILDEKLKSELRPIKEDLQITKEEVHTLKEEVHTLKEEVHTLKEEVHQIKLCQENIILPRLNTIESCYTDTYDRYRRYADKMETAFEDIEMLKRVVAEHSEKLQKLA